MKDFSCIFGGEKHSFSRFSGKISCNFPEGMVECAQLNMMLWKEWTGRSALSRCKPRQGKPGKEICVSKREEYEQKTEALLTPMMEEYGFELVDVEYVKEGGSDYLRAYIDKPGGITIDDCETVSRRLSDLLDEKDFIPGAYVLEVSSPGLGRPLKKEKDYARSIGKEVEIHTFRAVEHEKSFTGILTAYDKDSVTIALSEEETLKLDRSNLALIRLALDF